MPPVKFEKFKIFQIPDLLTIDSSSTDLCHPLRRQLLINGIQCVQCTLYTQHKYIKCYVIDMTNDRWSWKLPVSNRHDRGFSGISKIYTYISLLNNKSSIDVRKSIPNVLLSNTISAIHSVHNVYCRQQNRQFQNNALKWCILTC